MIYLFTVVIFSTFASSAVECRFNFPQVGETRVSVSNEAACQELIQDQIRMAYLTGRVCEGGANFSFSWSAGTESKNTSVACSELEAYKNAEASLETSEQAQSLLGDPGIANFDLNQLCTEDAPGISEISDFTKGGFVLTLGDDELRDVIRDFQLATGKTEEEIFRLIKDNEGSEFRLPFLLEKPEGGKEESAVKISFKKERNGVTLDCVFKMTPEQGQILTFNLTLKSGSVTSMLFSLKSE